MAGCLKPGANRTPDSYRLPGHPPALGIAPWLMWTRKVVLSHPSGSPPAPGCTPVPEASLQPWILPCRGVGASLNTTGRKSGHCEKNNFLFYVFCWLFFFCFPTPGILMAFSNTSSVFPCHLHRGTSHHPRPTARSHILYSGIILGRGDNKGEGGTTERHSEPRGEGEVVGGEP